MTANKGSIEDEVRKWLAKEGYRLEYLAHRAFSKVGLRAVLGGYVEGAEGKTREIDVTVFSEVPDENLVHARALCECKYSAESPWVLLATGLAADLWADWVSTPQSKPLAQR